MSNKKFIIVLHVLVFTPTFVICKKDNLIVYHSASIVSRQDACLHVDGERMHLYIYISYVK
jgi:hypothetical protein